MSMALLKLMPCLFVHAHHPPSPPPLLLERRRRSTSAAVGRWCGSERRHCPMRSATS